MFIISPIRFAKWFNSEVPGASREITDQDIRVMTEYELIGCYGCYGRQDLEAVRAVLQYEQMREKRSRRNNAKVVNNVNIFKRCGQPLYVPPPEKKGRHREYCQRCEHFRGKEPEPGLVANGISNG
jgi:hypothetical protein